MSDTPIPIKGSDLPVYEGDLANVYAIGFRKDTNPKQSVRFALPSSLKKGTYQFEDITGIDALNNPGNYGISLVESWNGQNTFMLTIGYSSWENDDNGLSLYSEIAFSNGVKYRRNNNGEDWGYWILVAIDATAIRAIVRNLAYGATTSTSVITVNAANQLQRDVNTGTTDTTIAFSNLSAIISDGVQLIIVNSRAAAMNVALPTSPFTAAGITYSFTLMLASPMAIPAGKSAELNFSFVFFDDTHCQIRIAGGVEV